MFVLCFDHVNLSVDHLDLFVDHLNLLFDHLDLFVDHLNLFVDHLDLFVDHLDLFVNYLDLFLIMLLIGLLIVYYVRCIHQNYISLLIKHIEYFHWHIPVIIIHPVWEILCSVCKHVEAFLVTYLQVILFPACLTLQNTN